MKTQLIPYIGLDFAESNGTRITCFQLCLRRESDNPRPESKLVAVAMADLNHNGELLRFYSTPELKPRESGIVRLARKYQTRSVPQIIPAHANR